MQAVSTYRHNPSATDVITPVFFAVARAVARIALLVAAVFVLLAVLRWYLTVAATVTGVAWLTLVAPALVFGGLLVGCGCGLMWLMVAK